MIVIEHGYARYASSPVSFEIPNAQLFGYARYEIRHRGHISHVRSTRSHTAHTKGRWHGCNADGNNLHRHVCTKSHSLDKSSTHTVPEYFTLCLGNLYERRRRQKESLSLSNLKGGKNEDMKGVEYSRRYILNAGSSMNMLKYLG
eukprot:scaffold10267_cov270-Chaetoceros_neogracile.AAC.21